MGSRAVRCGNRVYRWGRVRQWLPRRSAEVRLIWGCNTFVCWYYPHRGYYCSHVLRRMIGGDVERIDLDTEWRTMKKVKIGANAPNTGPRHLAAVETNLLQPCPAIVAHCAVTRYDDGDARRPGWIMVKTQGAMWSVTAKDPDAGASITATGQTLDDALALLDLLLGAEEAPWEPDVYLQNGRTGKRKS